MTTKRGPQKTPTDVLKRRGSWRGKLPERQNEVKPPALKAPPAPPPWLDKASRVHFRRLAPVLIEVGLVTVADTEIVAHLCASLEQWVKLCAACENAEPVVCKDDRVWRNPVFTMRSEAHRDLIRIMRELGMSPSARAGLTLSSPDVKAGDIVAFTGAGFAT